MLGSEIIISSIRTSDGSFLAGFSGILATLASFSGTLPSFSSAGLCLGALFGIVIGCWASFFGGSLLKRSRGSKRTATKLTRPPAPRIIKSLKLILLGFSGLGVNCAFRDSAGKGEAPLVGGGGGGSDFFPLNFLSSSKILLMAVSQPLRSRKRPSRGHP